MYNGKKKITIIDGKWLSKIHAQYTRYEWTLTKWYSNKLEYIVGNAF